MHPQQDYYDPFEEFVFEEKGGSGEGEALPSTINCKHLKQKRMVSGGVKPPPRETKYRLSNREI